MSVEIVGGGLSMALFLRYLEKHHHHLKPVRHCRNQNLRKEDTLVATWFWFLQQMPVTFNIL